MRLPISILIVAALFLFTGTVFVAAQDEAKSSPLPSHLPLRTEACFGRVYDAAHLASHPKQRVTGFHLSREFKSDPYSEYEPMPEAEMKDVDGENGNVIVTAYVRFRDRKGVYSNGLSCHKTDNGKTMSGVDCDGGSFLLRPQGQSLLLENNGFVVVGGCGASEDEQENEEHVSPGADDKLFRLDAKPVAACMAERAAMAPAWAKLGTPLRVRFQQQETVCFNRSYDSAHLAGHPEQTVKRIAVLKSKASRPDPADVTYYLSFLVETRDGRRIERRAHCLAGRYAYECQPDGPLDADRYFYLSRAADNDVFLRDRHGLLGKLFKVKLGSDDKVFRLKQSPAEACR